MGVQKVDIIDINIDNGNVFRTFAGKTICEGDESANVFGFRCVRNGEIVDLSGCSCIGYFVRGDGTTVVINGSVSLNRGFVTLPESCYIVPGNFTLAIKLSGGSISTTFRIIDGVVVNTTTDVMVDPGHVIPSVEDLLAYIDQANALSEIIESFSVVPEVISGDNYRIIITTTEGGE